MGLDKSFRPYLLLLLSDPLFTHPTSFPHSCLCTTNREEDKRKKKEDRQKERKKERKKKKKERRGKKKEKSKKDKQFNIKI